MVDLESNFCTATSRYLLSYNHSQPLLSRWAPAGLVGTSLPEAADLGLSPYCAIRRTLCSLLLLVACARRAGQAFAVHRICPPLAAGLVAVKAVWHCIVLVHLSDVMEAVRSLVDDPEGARAACLEGCHMRHSDPQVLEVAVVAAEARRVLHSQRLFWGLLEARSWGRHRKD